MATRCRMAPFGFPGSQRAYAARFRRRQAAQSPIAPSEVNMTRDEGSGTTEVGRQRRAVRSQQEGVILTV